MWWVRWDDASDPNGYVIFDPYSKGCAVVKKFSDLIWITFLTKACYQTNNTGMLILDTHHNPPPQ